MAKSTGIYEKFRGGWSKFFDFRSVPTGTISLGAWSNLLDGFFTHRKVVLGDKINEHSALTIPTVFACTKIISETVASLPCVLYEPDGKGGRRPAFEEDEYALFHDAPNDKDTAVEFFESYVASLLMEGDGFSYTPRNNRGRCDSVYWLPGRQVSIRIINGEPVYVTSAITGQQTALFNGDDMWHTKVFSRDGYRGTSLIRSCAELLGLNLAQTEFSASVIKNGASFKGIVSTDFDNFSEKQKDDLKKQLKADYSGSDNAGKFMYLPYNLKFQPITMTPLDAQMLDNAKLTERQIAAIFNVPMHMLQILDRATFNNVEQLQMEFIQLCLRKWCVRLEKSLNARVLNQGQRGRGLHFAFDFDELVRGATKDRFEAYAVAIQWGIFTRNEIRVKEQLNPLDGLDQVLTPLNFTTAPSPSDDSGAAEGSEDDAAATQNDEEEAPKPATKKPAKSPSNTQPTGKQASNTTPKAGKQTTKSSYIRAIDVAEEVLQDSIETLFNEEKAALDKVIELEPAERKKKLDKFYSDRRRRCAAKIEKPLKRLYSMNGREMNARDLMRASTSISQYNMAAAHQGATFTFEDAVIGATEIVLEGIGVQDL